MQATGGVDEYEIHAARCRGVHRVEDDRAGVGALLAADEVDADAVGPRPELLGRRGPERVGGGQQDPVTLRLLAPRQLRDGRRLPDAVDPHEHPDVRRTRFDAQRAVGAAVAVELGDELGAQELWERGGVADVARGGAGANTVQDPLRGRHPGVGEQERLFELVPRVVGQVAAASQPTDEAAEGGAGPRQPVPQSRRLRKRFDDRFGRWRLDDWFGRRFDDWFGRRFDDRSGRRLDGWRLGHGGPGRCGRPPGRSRRRGLGRCGPFVEARLASGPRRASARGTTIRSAPSSRIPRRTRTIVVPDMRRSEPTGGRRGVRPRTRRDPHQVRRHPPDRRRPDRRRPAARHRRRRAAATGCRRV